MLKEIKDWYSAIKLKVETDRREKVIKEAKREAEDKFSVVFRDGVPFVTYEGVIVTLTDDVDEIIDRLQILRERYIKDRIN